MSKFADKLQRVYRGSTPALGFRKSAGEVIPQMLLVVSLSNANAKAAKAVAAADAAIVSSANLDAEGFSQLSSAMGDVPLGLSLESVQQEEVIKLANSGCDFVVFDIKAPLEAVKKEGLGKILRIEASLDPWLARAVNGLPLSIDAVLVAGGDSSITIERLLICQRLADLLDKPLLVTASPSVNSDELSSLCQAGVRGVVVSGELTAKALSDLKKAIAGLPQRAKPKTRGVAMLPRVNVEPETVAEEEEEEEDI
jgi:hypothetical protein